MSVVLVHDQWDPCDLYWQSASVVVGAAGLWNLTLLPAHGGTWVAWTLTTSDASNATITISIGGDPVVSLFGASDGQIYSPANLPPLAPHQPVACNGVGTPTETVFFNVLLRRTS
jgi:hypothetical protein